MGESPNFIEGFPQMYDLFDEFIEQYFPGKVHGQQFKDKIINFTVIMYSTPVMSFLIWKFKEF